MAIKYIPDPVTPFVVDPANKLNLIPRGQIVDADTGLPIIDPVTGQPVALGDLLKANDQSEDLIAERLGRIQEALDIRLSLEAAKPAYIADLQAAVAKGEIAAKVKTDEEKAAIVASQYAGQLARHLQVLRLAAPKDDPELLSVEAELQSIYAAHPEYFGQRPTPPK